MFRPIFFITVAFGLVVLGPSYSRALAQTVPTVEQTQKRPVEVSIDPKIQRTETKLPGLNHGPPRPVGALVGPEGRTLEFVSNEIVLHPASDQELQDFIVRYHAMVLRDGMASMVGSKMPLRHGGPGSSPGCAVVAWVAPGWA